MAIRRGAAATSAVVCAFGSGTDIPAGLAGSDSRGLDPA